MNIVQKQGATLIGLALDHKTTNEGGQSAIDCGNLWKKFEEEHWADKIPGKLSDEIWAVYHSYEGDYTKPYSYFIGSSVSPGTTVPAGMQVLEIPAGSYQKIVAKGKIPDSVGQAWKEIWASGMSRAYRADYEIYDHRSRDLNNATVDIFISI